MKAKLILLTLAVFFLNAVVASADSPHMGTWKLNEAKSHFHKGANKNNTVVYEAAGDQIKVTVDGVDGSRRVHGYLWPRSARGTDQHASHSS